MSATNRPLIGARPIAAYFLEKDEAEVTLTEERWMRGSLQRGDVRCKKMGKHIVSTTAAVDAVKADIAGLDVKAA